MRGGGDLAGLAAHALDLGDEGAVRPEQPLERHGAGQVGEGGQPIGPDLRERADRHHGLGAVHERQALLGLEHDGPQPGPCERLAAGQALAADPRLALADDEECEVGERREVPGGADRPALGDHGDAVPLEQREDEVERLLPDAAVPLGEHVRPQEDERAGLLEGQGGSDAGGVREHQVSLELFRDRRAGSGPRRACRSRC